MLHESLTDAVAIGTVVQVVVHVRDSSLYPGVVYLGYVEVVTQLLRGELEHFQFGVDVVVPLGLEQVQLDLVSSGLLSRGLSIEHHLFQVLLLGHVQVQDFAELLWQVGVLSQGLHDHGNRRESIQKGLVTITQNITNLHFSDSVHHAHFDHLLLHLPNDFIVLYFKLTLLGSDVFPIAFGEVSASLADLGLHQVDELLVVPRAVIELLAGLGEHRFVTQVNILEFSVSEIGGQAVLKGLVLRVLEIVLAAPFVAHVVLVLVFLKALVDSLEVVVVVLFIKLDCGDGVLVKLGNLRVLVHKGVELVIGSSSIVSLRISGSLLLTLNVGHLLQIIALSPRKSAHSSLQDLAPGQLMVIARPLCFNNVLVASQRISVVHVA